MTGADPLSQALEAIGDTTVADDVVQLRLPEAPGMPEDPAALRFLMYVGLYDLPIEAALGRKLEDTERATMLSQALASVRSAEGPLRFARSERSEVIESRELVARMRGREIALTNGWMIPRLREDITDYRARIEALRVAIAEAGR
jgi:hypothetical protein